MSAPNPSPHRLDRSKEHEPDPWRLNEVARRKRLREDAQRPLAENLAEGLALSEFLSTFTDSARSS